MFYDATFETLCIGHKQVITNELDTIAKSLAKLFPALPVVFG